MNKEGEESEKKWQFYSMILTDPNFIGLDKDDTLTPFTFKGKNDLPLNSLRT